MSLEQDFLTPHAIDLEALARVKHRLFVVGRFNRREVSLPDKPPEAYLFTNRPDNELPKDYLAFFKTKFGLRFENFVRALQPAIAEEVRPGRIPAVIQYMPAQDGSEEGSVVIDMWNFFFMRAIANSDQKAFSEGMSSLAREILREGEKDAGRGIYKLIRKNLSVFCGFQPRTAQLAEAFSQLLDQCAELPAHGLPAYAAGGALPAGFLEKLIDFIYSPDVNGDFSLEGIDLSDEIWEKLRTSEKAQRSLIKAANSFRNVLVGAADMHGDMKILGGVTVYQTARQILGSARFKDLVKDFGQAREAYIALGQIIRSKVLLSMVLEWVVKAHYDLDEVKKIADADDQDQMVERLALGKVKSTAVAAPVKRATSEERERFRKQLADGFERLVLAVIADDARARTAMDEVPAELRGVAEAFRQDSGRRALLHRMATATNDPTAFIKSQQTILIDVLLPVLYQEPAMSLYDLRMLLRREVNTAYLTAIMLEDRYQGLVRQIGQEFLPTFLKNIDETTREIRNGGTMRSELSRTFLERIVSTDMAERIIEAQDAVARAMTVLEHTTLKHGETRGASHISPFLLDTVSVTKKTLPAKRTDEAIGNLAVETLKETLANHDAEKETEKVEADASEGKRQTRTAAASIGQPAVSGRSIASPPSGGSSAASSGSGSDAASSSGSTSSAAKQPEPPRRDSLQTDMRAMVDAFVASNPTKPRSEMVDEVRDKATADQAVIEKAHDSIRVFHHVLKVIYDRYRDNQDKKGFIGQVERMTLANLMVVNQEALGLGKACSNLYAMLLDVVENMDPENPEPKSFIKNFSLTRYFDNDVLEKDQRNKSGITALRQTLRGQADESLKNTVSFISELRGVKYLMDAVAKDPKAEIIVVNATAAEFSAWLQYDNLSGDEKSQLTWRSNFIIGADKPNACPGLVYLTDSAFAGDGSGAVSGKAQWLQSLKNAPLVQGNLRLVMPPLCLSTGPKDKEGTWVDDGKELAQVAEPPVGAGSLAPPAAVVIVGPSPFMNRPDDSFGTYLPAGYVFAAHFLNQPEQHVTNGKVKETDQGRFRVIGTGIGTMRDTLERIVWGGDSRDTYAFAADFYLYILLQMLATAMNRIGPADNQPSAQSYFPYFTGHRNTGIQQNNWKTSEAIDNTLIGKATDFALEQNVAKQRLTAVCLQRGTELNIRGVEWFNQALERANLPRYPQGN